MGKAAEAVVRRWRNVSLAPAFEMMKHRAVKQKMMRNQERKIVLQWLGRGMLRAFASWKHCHAARRGRLRKVASKVARRQGQSLRPLMMAWIEQVINMRKMRVTGAKIMMRWRHMAVAPAMDRWIDDMRKSQKRSHASEKAATRRRDKALSRGFACWSDARGMGKGISRRWRSLALRAATSKHISQHMTSVRLEAQHHVASTSRGSHRNRSLLCVFLRWHSIALLSWQRRRHANAVSQVLDSQRTRAVRALLEHVIGEWAEYASFFRVRQIALCRLAGRKRLSAVAAVFDAWCAETQPSGYHTPLEGDDEGMLLMSSSSNGSNTMLTASTVRATVTPTTLLSSRRSGTLVRKLAIC